MTGLFCCRRRTSWPPAWHAAVAGTGFGLRTTSTDIDLNDFTLEEWIGDGTFSKVWLASHKSEGHSFAVKQIPKGSIIQKKQVERMVAMRSSLDAAVAPFVSPLLHFCHDSRNLYFVHELVRGTELFAILRRAGRFEKATVRFYILQVAAAIVYLHSHRILHRNATPENIMIAKDGYLQLVGFGFSKVLPDQGSTYTLVGVPEYIAPEILKNKGHDLMVDWWILGILAFEMLVGNPPFLDDDPANIYAMILAGRVYTPQHVEASFRDLINGLLSADVERRRSCVANNAFFRGIDWEALLSKKLPAPKLLKAEYQSVAEPPLAPVVQEADDPFCAHWPRGGDRAT